MQSISAFQEARARYQPKLPAVLCEGKIGIQLGDTTQAVADEEEIRKMFPLTYGQRIAALTVGEDELSSVPLRVGVVLSGGPASGGHNVIAGLFDALKSANNDSRLFGFLQGPKGIIQGKYKELTAEVIDAYRNTGGFDMIRSGRDKIETAEDLAACEKTFAYMGLQGLVIVGGDDSNTNAAVLAEHLRAHGSATSVIGVPKTIDGDLKNEWIDTSFGYDTACKTYSELIGNICRDAASAAKYWHFIKLMGRTASYVTLECVLQTHPNVALISEEIQSQGITIEEIVDLIVDVVVKRAEVGRNYGVVVVPEGLPEFIPDIKAMIDELSTILGQDEAYIQSLPDHSERLQYLSTQLSEASAKVYSSLPPETQEVLLTRDSHGNVPLSQVETERLLIDLVSDRIRLLNAHKEKKIPFSPLSHFFGYEGRCTPPSNFDADYCYSLGYTAVQLIRANLTGYTVSIRGLIKPSDQWIAGGIPTSMMLCMEMRKGRPTLVIKKALVDLDGRAFKIYATSRGEWALKDSYLFPGPIQYFGPGEVSDCPPITLTLEDRSVMD